MKKNSFVNIVLIVIIILLVGVVGYFLFGINPVKIPDTSNDITILPDTCKDEQEGIPVITSLSSYSGSIGTKLEMNGCNFSGFEGDKNIWIENEQGIKGILYGEANSTSKLIRVVLKSSLCQKDTSYSGMPCDATLTLNPGVYKIFVDPWGKQSNKVSFTIK